MAFWEKHLYAQVEIPENDAAEIRQALETVLLDGNVALTDGQKRLLTKLRERLGELESVTHAGPPKW